MTKIAKTKLTIWLEEAQAKKLKHAAIDADMSISDFMSAALEERFRRAEKEEKEIKQQ